jgi:hypothetical protein
MPDDSVIDARMVPALNELFANSLVGSDGGDVPAGNIAQQQAVIDSAYTRLTAIEHIMNYAAGVANTATPTRQTYIDAGLADEAIFDVASINATVFAKGETDVDTFEEIRSVVAFKKLQGFAFNSATEVAVGAAFDYVGVATETGAYDGGLTSNTQVTAFGTVLGGAGDQFNAYQLFDNKDAVTAGNTRNAYVESFKSNSTFAWIDPADDAAPVLMKGFDVVPRPGYGGTTRRLPNMIKVEGFDPDKGTWVDLGSFNITDTESTKYYAFSGTALSQKVIGLRFTMGASDNTPMNLAEIKPYAYEIEYRAQPSVEDYVLAGFTSVTADNLYSVNRAVESLSPANNSALAEGDITAAISTAQSNIASALATIDTYAKTDGGGTAPSLETYLIAGLQGVTAANKSAIDTAVAGVDNATGIPDLAALKVVAASAIDTYNLALQRIGDFAKGESEVLPTFDDFVDSGLTDGITVLAGNENAFAQAAAWMLTDLNGINASKMAYAVANMQSNLKALADKIQPTGDQTTLMAKLYDYAASVGMDSMDEYQAQNNASGVDLSISELNDMLGNTYIDTTNYQAALERIIGQESIPVSNPSDANEQFNLFQNQITSDVAVSYATMQATQDTTPYIKVDVAAGTVGEAWDIVYKTSGGSYVTILSNHTITQAEADQGFFALNDATGLNTSAVDAQDGYINVVRHGDTAPVAADYFFDYS